MSGLNIHITNHGKISIPKHAYAGCFYCFGMRWIVHKRGEVRSYYSGRSVPYWWSSPWIVSHAATGFAMSITADAIPGEAAMNGVSVLMYKGRDEMRKAIVKCKKRVAVTGGIGVATERGAP